jgi:chemotaxis methyl-accepting protein methylase
MQGLEYDQPNGRSKLRGVAGVPQGHRGFDITEYKRSSLMRRVNRRMQAVGVGAGAYIDFLGYLEVNPDKFKYLFGTILINLTNPGHRVAGGPVH